MSSEDLQTAESSWFVRDAPLMHLAASGTWLASDDQESYTAWTEENAAHNSFKLPETASALYIWQKMLYWGSLGCVRFTSQSKKPWWKNMKLLLYSNQS